jgi:hypothetical protein
MIQLPFPIVIIYNLTLSWICEYECMLWSFGGGNIIMIMKLMIYSKTNAHRDQNSFLVFLANN